MPSRAAYDRLQELALQELPHSVYTPGSVACVLMKSHADELAELGFVPGNDGYAKDWEWECDAYVSLEPRVRRQLENLVKTGKVVKDYRYGHHGRRNFAHRIAIYLPREVKT